MESASARQEETTPPSTPPGSSGGDVEWNYLNLAKELRDWLPYLKDLRVQKAIHDAGYRAAELPHDCQQAVLALEHAATTIQALRQRLAEAEARADEHFKNKLSERAIRMICETDLATAIARATAAESTAASERERAEKAEAALLAVATFDAEHMSALAAIQRMKNIARMGTTALTPRTQSEAGKDPSPK